MTFLLLGVNVCVLAAGLKYYMNTLKSQDLNCQSGKIVFQLWFTPHTINETYWGPTFEHWLQSAEIVNVIVFHVRIWQTPLLN